MRKLMLLFYTITPSKSGYKFLPRKRTVTVIGADVANQNFSARVPKMATAK